MSIVATEVRASGSDVTKFMCELCSVSFGKRGSLYTHLRRKHQLQVGGVANKKCPLCCEKFCKMNLLHEHIQTQHSITLNFVDKTFYTETDFLDWKNKIEKESMSFFKHRNTTTYEKDCISLRYYECHRSGSCKVRQNRIRNFKASGSIRIGSTCPVFMKVVTQTVDEISEIKVQYQSVHAGHDLETRTLKLNRKDRENIAACLKLGIPMDKILEEAKRNFNPTNPYWHLTRKTLYNIKRDYGLLSLNTEKPKKVGHRDFGKSLNTEKPKMVIGRDFGISLNTEKPQKVNILKNADVEASDSSIGYEDYIEFEVSNNQEVSIIEEVSNNQEVSIIEEVSNHKEIQEHEKNIAVSSLLLLQQNKDYSEELRNRKLQIVSQLKELQTRIEEWKLEDPLPHVEEHIKAINARLDMSASSNLLTQGMLPIFTFTPTNKPVTKHRKITKKKDSKKTSTN